MSTLYDADTAEPIGPASAEHEAASDAAALRDGGAGIFVVDEGLRPVPAGSPFGVRRVYAT